MTHQRSIGGAFSAALLGAQDQHAGRNLDHLGVGTVLRLQRRERLVARAVVLPVVERLLGVLAEEVEARVRGGLRRAARRVVGQRVRALADPDARALRRLQDRGAQPDDRLARGRVDVRVGLALVVEDVRFPVVEEQLGGRTDLPRCLLGVLDARQVDLDLVLAGLVDLGLGDAERVDALLHEVDRPLHGVGVDDGLRRGRLCVVDELDTALQVQAELGRLGQDNCQRAADEGDDDEQYEE